MSLPTDVEFRLRAAAKVLERAANRASDSELKKQLEALAISLREVANGNLNALWNVEKTGARAKTLDEVVNEVRNWIWEGIGSKNTSPKELESEFADKVLDPLRMFERLIDEIDRKLSKIIPD